MSGPPPAPSHATRPAEHLPLPTGRGRCVGDLVLPGMGHVALLRSPHARWQVLRWLAGRSGRGAGALDLTQ